MAQALTGWARAAVVAPLAGCGSVWTPGVTGAAYLRLDAGVGLLALLALVVLFHAIIGRSWGVKPPDPSREEA